MDLRHLCVAKAIYTPRKVETENKEISCRELMLPDFRNSSVYLMSFNVPIKILLENYILIREL